MDWFDRSALAACYVLAASTLHAQESARSTISDAIDSPPRSTEPHANAARARFTDWGKPVSVGQPPNSEFGDLCPTVSEDGRSLYFFSNRPGGLGGNDLWVAQRNKISEPWGPPQNLGAPTNTPFDDNAASLSEDGHALYFTSNRPDGFGGFDLYVSRRPNKRNDFGWRAPENAGAGVNTSASEVSPAYFEDHDTGKIALYFASDRPGGLGLDDIYVATLDEEDESFGPATLVEELSSPFADRLPGIRDDGLEMFVTSDRTGTIGALDVWVSTRKRTSSESGAERWSIPINLGQDINSIAVDGCARLTHGDRILYFHSTRLGGAPLFDLYVATRDRLRRIPAERDFYGRLEEMISDDR